VFRFRLETICFWLVLLITFSTITQLCWNGWKWYFAHNVLIFAREILERKFPFTFRKSRINYSLSQPPIDPKRLKKYSWLGYKDSSWTKIGFSSIVSSLLTSTLSWEVGWRVRKLPKRCQVIFHHGVTVWVAYKHSDTCCLSFTYSLNVVDLWCISSSPEFYDFSLSPLIWNRETFLQSTRRYSLTSPYEHLYNTDTSLLRTVRLVPEMPKIIHSLPL